MQAMQPTKLQVSPAVLNQQQQGYAAAVNEAGSNGLQRHAARLNVMTATHCSRCHHSAEAICTGDIPAMQHQGGANH